MSVQPILKRGNNPPPPTVEGLDNRLVAVETLLPTLATKADIAAVTTEVHKVHVDFGRWVVATIVTLLFGITAATTSLVTLLKPAAAPPIASQQPAPPQQPQPVIINNIPPQPSLPEVTPKK